MAGGHQDGAVQGELRQRRLHLLRRRVSDDDGVSAPPPLPATTGPQAHAPPGDPGGQGAVSQPALAHLSTKSLGKPRQLCWSQTLSSPNTCASLPKGHSPGWGHPGRPPEKNPEQYPGDAGTDEPGPVCGGVTLACLGARCPRAAPSAPRRRPVLRPLQGQPPARRPRATRKNQAALQPRDATKNTYNSNDGKKGKGGEESGSGRGGTHREVLKEDSHTEIHDGSWVRKKGLGRSLRLCLIGDGKQLLSNSLWEGESGRSPETLSGNECEGERQEPPPLLSSAAPGGLTRQPSVRRGQRTDGQTASPEPLWENPFQCPLDQQSKFSALGE